MAIPGSVIRFILSTLPFLAVLLYLLYKTWERPHLARAAYLNNSNNNNNGNGGYDDGQSNDFDDGGIFSLMDILLIFLSFHVVWTLFAVYLMVFIPKRRHFLGWYISEGSETSLGDVIYDPESRLCGRMQDYGYALYAHPTQPHKVVRKRVRVYQAYTRERLTICRLPNRPLSGQPKIDIQIDLGRMKKERDATLRWITWVALSWVLFSLGGAIYVLFQMSVLENHGGHMVFNENFGLGLRLFLTVVGVNIPLCYAINWIRFLIYHNWMVNRAALIENENEARQVRGCCLNSSDASADGSDTIPYSILNGDSVSYQGTLPTYTSSKKYQAPPPPPQLLKPSDGETNASHRSFRGGKVLA